MVSTAIIGTGYWGRNVVNSVMRSARGELRWLCDADRDRLDALAALHPSVPTTDDIDRVLQDPTVDTVIIVTPTQTHYHLTQRALKAGKHVLVEKPLTANAVEAESLCRLAAQVNRVLMVGHIFRYNAAVGVLSDLIQAGELGNIFYMNFERTNLGPVRLDVNALWDLASHDVSIMCDLMAEMPVRVSATGQEFLNASVEDVVFATFQFATGALAHVHVSWLNPRKVRQLTVVGSKKMVTWDDLDLRQPLRLYEKRVEPRTPDQLIGSFLEYKTMIVDSGVILPTVMTHEPLLAEINHFFECIVTDTSPQSDGTSGLQVVRCIEAAVRSMRAGGRSERI